MTQNTSLLDWDTILRLARDNHYKATKHTNIFIGNNFVECLECHKHACISSSSAGLYEHDKGYNFYNSINPNEF